MPKFITFFIFCLLSLTSPAVAGNKPLDAYRPVPEQIAQTCIHYENRARFKARDATSDFDVILADSCDEAMRDAFVRFDTNPYTHKRAMRFLNRLAEMKQLIIRLNMERTFGADYHARSQPQVKSRNYNPFEQRTTRLISKAGEYLIAREIGLVDAYREWSHSNGFQSAALR